MPEAYRVELESFRGPMDLLLHLVKEEEVSVHEVPIARVVDQYLSFLEHAEVPDLDTAGEFLVFAATLMSLKARALLPQEVVDLEQELDPGEDLLRQLLSYRRYRALADGLRERWNLRSARFGRPSRPRPEGDDVERPLEEIELFDLAKGYAKLLRETLALEPRVIVLRDRPLGDYMEWVARHVAQGGRIAFSELRRGFHSRAEVVGLFLALLEMLRLGKIEVVQDEIFGEMEIRAAASPDGDRDDPNAGGSERATRVDDPPA